VLSRDGNCPRTTLYFLKRRHSVKTKTENSCLSDSDRPRLSIIITKNHEDKYLPTADQAGSTNGNLDM
jgi:hypothetical protein